jgi:hypothetical protein
LNSTASSHPKNEERLAGQSAETASSTRRFVGRRVCPFARARTRLPSPNTPPCGNLVVTCSLNGGYKGSKSSRTARGLT